MYVLKFAGSFVGHYIGESFSSTDLPLEGRSYPVPRKTLNNAKLFETREEAVKYLTYLFTTFDKNHRKFENLVYQITVSPG